MEAIIYEKVDAVKDVFRGKSFTEHGENQAPTNEGKEEREHANAKRLNEWYFAVTIGSGT